MGSQTREVRQDHSSADSMYSLGQVRHEKLDKITARQIACTHWDKSDRRS